MKANYGSLYNVIEHIEDTFTEVDNDVCGALLVSNDKYATLFQKCSDLVIRFPIILKVINGSDEGGAPICLTMDEHDALLRWFNLRTNMESIKRKCIYIRGHMDNVAYLKQVTGINIPIQ